MKNSDNSGILAQVSDYMLKNEMLPPQGGGILCAVSGGADSMCMLSILCKIAPSADIKVAAAHFNHHLRGNEALRDEMFVRRFCEEAGIEFFSGEADVKALSVSRGIGIEEAARDARYSFLENTALENNFSRIMTAHNADDNLETIILNLARGSGSRGLAGIPPRRGIIARPVLILTRAEIEAYMCEDNLPFVMDSTNLSTDYSRNKVRHSVLPVLRELNPAAAENSLKASRLLREDDDYLNTLAEEFVRNHRSGNKLPASALSALPRPVSSRAVRLMSQPYSVGEVHVNTVLELCDNPSPSASCNLPGFRVRREYDFVVFQSVNTGRIQPRNIFPGDNFELYPGGPHITCQIAKNPPNINTSLNTFYFKNDNIYGRILVGLRKMGDSIRLSNRGITKSLRKLFIEAKIPKEERDLVPIIRDDHGVIAVGGFGVAERVAALPGEEALEIKIEERK